MGPACNEGGWEVGGGGIGRSIDCGRVRESHAAGRWARGVQRPGENSSRAGVGYAARRWAWACLGEAVDGIGATEVCQGHLERAHGVNEGEQPCLREPGRRTST